MSGKHEKNFKPDSGQVGIYRNKSLVDTPANVVVINRALLDAQNDHELADALKNVAGVTQQGTSPLTSNSFAVHGVPTDSRTSYRMNGTLPVINYVPFPLEDKERVEVLSGVQAIYYGFTTPAALVNMVMKRAGKDPVTSLRLDGDANGSFGGGFDVGRLYGAQGQFGLRLNAYGMKIGTPLDNIGGNRWLVSGAFDYRVSSRLNFQLDVEHFERTMGEPGAVFLPSVVGAVKGVGGTLTLPPLIDATNHYAPVDAAYKGRSTNVIGRANWNFADGWTAHVEMGTAHNHRARWVPYIGSINYGTGEGTLAGNVSPGEDYANDSVRVEVDGKITTGTITQDVMIGFSNNRLFQLKGVASTYSVAQNYYNPRIIYANQLSYTTKGGNPSESLTYDRGFYAIDTIHPVKWLDLIGGVRQSDFTNNSIGGTFYVEHTLSPVGAAVVKPMEHWSIYGSYVQGLEGGGTAPLGTANYGQVLPPLTSNSIEVGTKLDMHGTLISLVGFHVQRPLTYTNASNVYVEDGRELHEGVSFSVQGQITRHLSTAMNAQYEHDVQQNTSVAAQNGKPTLNSPETSGSIFLRYMPPMLEHLGINAGVYYTGSRSADVQNRARLASYATVSLGADYELKLRNHRSLMLRISSDNLLNKSYWATTGDNYLYVGLPRTVRFSVSTNL